MPNHRFHSILQLAGLTEGPVPALEDCDYHTNGRATAQCKAGCEGDGCFFVGSVDMLCTKNRMLSCPDDETCCQNEAPK